MVTWFMKPASSKTFLLTISVFSNTQENQILRIKYYSEVQ